MSTLNALDLVMHEQINADKYDLHVVYKGNIVCTAVYTLIHDEINLMWIETCVKFQRQGIASIVLNYLCDKLTPQGSFKINVVDEETLNGFYLKWFQKRTDPENNNPDAVLEKFSSLIDDSSLPKLILSADDALWNVGAFKNEFK